MRANAICAKQPTRPKGGIMFKRCASWVMVLLGLGGCAVGENYQRPTLDLPPTANEPVAKRDKWWRVFNDTMLDALVDEALAHNLDLQVAAARVAESAAMLGLTTAEQLPTAYFNGSSDRNRNSSASGRSAPGQPLDTTTHRLALQVSYEIDFWGKYRRSTEAARAQLLAVEANRDALRLSLTALVAQGYFNLIALDAQIHVGLEAIRRGKEALAMQKLRFEAGVISEFEYQQRAAELDAGLAQLPPLQSQQSHQERALSVLLGRSPRLMMAGGMERAKAPGALAASSTILSSAQLLARPDIVEAEQKLIAANAHIGVARAAYFPSISLTGLFGTESSALSNLFSGPSRVWNFAGNATQALWGAGRLSSESAASEARKGQALAQYQAAIANAFREVQDALAAQQAAREVYELQQRRAATLTKSWNLAKLRYEHGVASQLEVIDAERGLLIAEQSRIEAERLVRFAVADLFKALGG